MSEELYLENQRYQVALRTISHTLSFIIEAARKERATHTVDLLNHLQGQIQMTDPFYSSISHADIERTSAVLARLRKGGPNYAESPDDPR